MKSISENAVLSSLTDTVLAHINSVKSELPHSNLGELLRSNPWTYTESIIIFAVYINSYQRSPPGSSSMNQPNNLGLKQMGSVLRRTRTAYLTVELRDQIGYL